MNIKDEIEKKLNEIDRVSKQFSLDIDGVDFDCSNHIHTFWIKGRHDMFNGKHLLMKFNIGLDALCEIEAKYIAELMRDQYECEYENIGKRQNYAVEDFPYVCPAKAHFERLRNRL